MTQTWFIHNFDPIAFELFGAPMPWYWLNYLFGFVFCWSFIHLLLKRHPVMTFDDFQSYALWCWIGLLLGARLGYILIYQFRYFSAHPDQILALWNGGMSFHGALIGTGVAAYLVSRRRHTSLLAFTDMFTTVIPWPLATGRICNFLNGELPGRVTSIPWAVMFPAPWNDAPRHPSQLYEAVGEGVLLGLIMAAAWSKWHSIRGRMTALFLAGYGTIRFVTEFTREADPQLGYVASFLTMGQMLCLLMISMAVIVHRYEPNLNTTS